jgi:hypothetical protein
MGQPRKLKNWNRTIPQKDPKTFDANQSFNPGAVVVVKDPACGRIDELLRQALDKHRAEDVAEGNLRGAWHGEKAQ